MKRMKRVIPPLLAALLLLGSVSLADSTAAPAPAPVPEPEPIPDVDGELAG